MYAHKLFYNQVEEFTLTNLQIKHKTLHWVNLQIEQSFCIKLSSWTKHDILIG